MLRTKSLALVLSFAVCSILSAVAFPGCGQAAKAGNGPTSIDGFVTSVQSPSELEVGSQRIVLNADAGCAVLNAGAPSLLTSPKSRAAGFWVMYANGGLTPFRRFSVPDRNSISCSSLHIVVGDWLHAEGIREGSGAFRASRITITFFKSPPWMSGDALLEEPAVMGSRVGDATIWIDGLPVLLTSKTDILTASGRTFFPTLIPGGTMRMGESTATQPKMSASANAGTILNVDDWAEYLIGTEDAQPAAFKLVVWPNRVDEKERKYRDSYAVKVKSPDYANRKPGSIQINGDNPTAMVPEKSAQRWISALGASIVPQYLHRPASGVPTKIDFRFYIVRPFRLSHVKGLYPVDGRVTYCLAPQDGCLLRNRLKSGRTICEIVPLPDGTILVPECVLFKLRNEAQLAALLSYAIAEVLQKDDYHSWMLQTYRGRISFSNEKNGMNNSKYLYDYSVRLNEDVLRLGIRQLFLAGYDIREAPFAWALEQDLPIMNPVTGSRKPERDIPWYVTFGFYCISNYYSDVDYTKLKRGEVEYAQFLEELREVDSGELANRNE